MVYRSFHVSVMVALVLSAGGRDTFADGREGDAPRPGAPAHFLGYGVSVDAMQAREDLLVPQRFVGPQLAASLRWTCEIPAARFGAALGASFSYMFEDHGQPGVTVSTWARLEAVFRFAPIAHHRVELGGLWRSRVSDGFYPSWDDAHFYVLASHVIGPSLRYAWTGLDKLDIIADLRLPFFGFNGRSMDLRTRKQEYPNGRFLFAEPHENLLLAAPPEYLSLEFEVGARWHLRRSRLRLSYVLDFEREARPRPVARLSHCLVLTQEFGLGGVR